MSMKRSRVFPTMDKHGIKMSSFMIGHAIEKAPDLAKEIVRRGHEVAAHGRTWQNSYAMTPDEERRFIADRAASIERITGTRPLGWNAYWLRNSAYTLDILQDLGFLYHIDQPYKEGATQGRMMVVSLHDRISGHANRGARSRHRRERRHWRGGR
ncbi:hypothetical protein EQZ23_16025 [Sphingomonas sp. UV9]|nr:hypothetical protein EQZ23_16025 [Sphingomonas sp. UV9]